MKFIKWLSKIDRRIIFLLVTLVVLIPLLFNIPIPFEVGKPVQDAYNAIDSLKPGSVLMLSVDYDPTSAPECQPMMNAILEHAFRKNLKIIMLGHLVNGLPLGFSALEDAAKAHNKVYGVDYVNLGYNPGGASVMVGIGREIRNFYRTDYRGVNVDSFPLMKNVHNYNDVSVLISFAHGDLVSWWVEYAWGRYKTKIIGAVTGVVAPDLYPYLQANQMVGMLGGLKGASEYESLVKKPGMATRGMPAQSTAHILIIILIVIGSIADFVVDASERRKK